MFRFDCVQPTLSIFELDRPTAGGIVVTAACNLTACFDLTTHRLRLFSTRFPHHAWTSAGITEGIDQRLDHFRSIAIVALRQQCVLDRAAKRKPFNALRGPVCGNFPAAHAPDLLGVALEESVEESSAELVAYPLFKVTRIADWEDASFQPGEHAKNRFEDAEL